MKRGWRDMVIAAGFAIVMFGVLVSLAVAPILLRNNLETVNASALRSELMSLHLSVDAAREAARDWRDGAPEAEARLTERSQLLLHRVRVVLAYPGVVETLPGRAEDMIRMERFLDARLTALVRADTPDPADLSELADIVREEGASLDRYVLDAFHRLGRVASLERARVENLGITAQQFAVFLFFLAVLTVGTLWFQRRELNATSDMLRATVTELAETHRIAHVGTVRWDFRRDHVTWSDELARIYGLPCGGKLSGAEFQKLLVPADEARVVSTELDALARSAASGKPERREVRYRAYRNDGAIIELEAMSELLADADGNPVSMISTVRDISDEASAKRALTESQRRLAAAQRITNLGSFRRDVKSGKREWSRELYQMLGRDPGSQPQSLEEIVHPGDVDAIRALVDNLCKADGPFARKKKEFNCRFLRADGDIRYVRGTVEVSMDENGAAETLTGAMQDQTDDVMRELALRDALEEAERANEAKSRFLAIASHELRTPMNGVMGMLGELNETPLSETQKSHVTVALDSANALMTILNDILDMSKIEAGRLEIAAEPFDLHATVAGVMDLHAQQARDKGLTFDTLMDADVPQWVSGDPGRLRQILVNLVNNAIKFTPKGSITLAVATLPPTGTGDLRLRFSVTDTGIGIPMEKQKRVFDRFDQLDTSYTRRFGGTGLGLSISQSLVKLMGGTLDFESKVGQGSIFTLEIPVQHSAPPVATRPPEPVTALAPMRILVADDNDTNLTVAKAMLETLGQTVDLVTDGQAAVAAARATRYDLILMDLSMPDMDGFDATRRIRADSPGGAAPPIIALTAHAGPAERAACDAAGFREMLTKPVSRQVLQRVLATLQQEGNVTWDRSADAVAPPVPSAASNTDTDTADATALQAAIEEFRESLGADAVPDMLHAGLGDLRRHRATLSDYRDGGADTYDPVRNAFHSIGGITRLFGCNDLGDTARALETRQQSVPRDDPQLDALLVRVCNLCAHLESALRRESRSEQPPASGDTR